MQQDPSLQIPLNPNGQGAYSSNQYGAYPPNPQGGYPQQPPHYPQFNSYNNNRYQQNPQSGYPPAYNAPTYQQPYAALPQGQSIVDNNQMQAMTAQNAAYSIESRIITGFCCYTCLVYFELVVSFAALIYGIVFELDLNGGGFIALDVCTAVCMFIACICALIAKANFDKAKQYSAFLLFIFATILNITSIVVLLVRLENYKSYHSNCYDYFNNCNDEEILEYAVVTAGITGAITAIPIQLLIGFGLICNAHSLVQLMRKREEYLEEAKRRNYASSALAITS